MHRSEKERAITAYFDMWISRDFSALDSIFAEDVFYSECYGPEYRGLREIHLWVEEMLSKQTRLKIYPRLIPLEITPS